MAFPKVGDDRLREAVALVEAVYQDGFAPGKGAMAEATRRGMVSGAITNHTMVFRLIELAETRLGLRPDDSVFRQARYQQPVPRAQIRPVRDVPVGAPPGEPVRVLVIPDRHNDPRYPHRLECTTWIARFGSEMRPSHVVDLGDAISMDSCSRHDRDDTVKGRLKPFIKDDLSNHLESLQAFERGRAADWRPKLKKCRGNHEQRLWLYENENPAAAETHTLAYSEQLLQFGWQERPFGEIFYVGGVGFTHCPLNGMGKPMGGKTGTQRAGDMLTGSLVHGHTHRRGHYSATKLGLTDSISVIQAGCALPWGEVENYAMLSPTGWWWGVVLLTCWDGQVIDENWVSMLTLRNRYSDDGADIRAA